MQITVSDRLKCLGIIEDESSKTKEIDMDISPYITTEDD